MIDWSLYFYYDESSPSWLRWAIYRNSNANKDGVAGSIMKDGRYSVALTIRGKLKRYYCHRIIYELMHSIVIPSNRQIDHIDGNPLNNKIENLRMVDSKTNGENKRMSKRNSTGTTGVSYTMVDGYEYFTATWVENSKRMYKHFPVHKLGGYAEVLAKEFRANKIKELNLNGCNYTERHGT